MTHHGPHHEIITSTTITVVGASQKPSDANASKARRAVSGVTLTSVSVGETTSVNNGAGVGDSVTGGDRPSLQP